MIDTLEIYSDITSEAYEKLFDLTDKAARFISSNQQPLHKCKKHTYKTTAFQHKGFLEIGFQTNKKFKKFKIRIKLKPIRLLYPNSKIMLSGFKDFEKISNRFQELLYSIFNDYVSALPSGLGKWRVARIDYAINISTPLVSTYIKLFHFGLRPRACKSKSEYETSYYLKGNEYNINFYDKLRQLSEKKYFSMSYIIDEIGEIPEGILRLEVQCKSRYVNRFIEKKGIPSNHLEHLWNRNLAEWCLKKSVKRLIGTEDIHSVADNQKKLCEKHGYRFCSNCDMLMNFFVEHPGSSLEDVVQSMPNPERWKRFIYNLRKEGVNPIPLEAIYDMEVVGKDFVLENPYHNIRF